MDTKLMIIYLILIIHLILLLIWMLILILIPIPIPIPIPNPRPKIAWETAENRVINWRKISEKLKTTEWETEENWASNCRKMSERLQSENLRKLLQRALRSTWHILTMVNMVNNIHLLSALFYQYQQSSMGFNYR